MSPPEVIVLLHFTFFQNGIYLCVFCCFIRSSVPSMDLNFSLHSCCRFIGGVIAEHYFCVYYVIPYGSFILTLERIQGEKCHLWHHHFQSHQDMYIYNQLMPFHTKTKAVHMDGVCGMCCIVWIGLIPNNRNSVLEFLMCEVCVPAEEK